MLDLVVDAPHVLPDHAQGDQLDSAEQQDRDRDRAEPGQVGVEDAQADHDRDRDECDPGGQHAGVGRELQRKMGEGSDRIE